MKKLNTKGFGIVEGLLILVIVGIMGGVGYYVYTQNKDSDTTKNSASQQQSPKKTEPRLSLDESKVPERWNIINNSSNLVLLDNVTAERKTKENCFVEVEVVNDKDARIVGSSADEKNVSTEKYADKLRQARNSKAEATKGYEASVPDLRSNPREVIFGEPQGEFNTSQGLNSYPFYSGEIYKLTLPYNPEATLYQHLGIIIRDGHYVSIVQSCSSGDLREAYEALRAVIIDIDPLF